MIGTAELPSWVYERAPCLRSGPLAEAGRRVAAGSLAMGASVRADVMRSLAVPRVFEAAERIFADTAAPYPRFAEILEELARWFETSGTAAGDSLPRADASSIEAFTAAHYGNLFAAFDPVAYRDEPVKLLRDRLTNNGIDPDRFKDCLVLDAGCGGGRYSAAWRALGARPVVGVDMSHVGVRDAAQRTREAATGDLFFAAASVLQLPFADGTFDVVFSNGVLHHTRDWRAGVTESVRVLKPGGFGWLYVIEDPGGIFWESVEILRVVMSEVEPALARSVLRLAGLPPNRIFYMLDHVMVPINVRLSPATVSEALEAAGARSILRLTRGTSFDRIEQIHRGIPHARDKFGAGENRFTFTK